MLNKNILQMPSFSMGCSFSSCHLATLYCLGPDELRHQKDIIQSLFLLAFKNFSPFPPCELSGNLFSENSCLILIFTSSRTLSFTLISRRYLNVIVSFTRVIFPIMTPV